MYDVTYNGSEKTVVENIKNGNDESHLIVYG